MKIRTIFVILITAAFTLVNAQQSVKFKVKAGILLKSGNKISRLKSRDRVIPGDKMRIFINPTQQCYTYVVYQEGDDVYLLNDKLIDYSAKAVRPLVLPSSSEYYEFDKNSSNANITILCSKVRIPEVDELFSKKSQTNEKNWENLSAKLHERVKSNVSGEIEKPISMAGNVRDAETNFMNKLQTFSGKKLIIKDYKVEVKK